MKQVDFKGKFARNAVLLLGSTMTIMAGTAVSTSIPQMREVFGGEPRADLWVRLVLTLPALFIGIGAPLWGYILDRFGRKTVLAGAVFCYGLFGCSGFFLNDLFAILISRALFGLAVAGVSTGFTTLIADYFFEKDLTNFRGLQAAFMGFGGVFYLLMGGILADVSWRAPFLIYAFAFLLLPGVFLFLYEPPIQREKEAEGFLQGIKPCCGKLVLVYGLAFLGMALFYMIPVQVPFYLASFDGVSNTQIGMSLASMTLVAATLSTQYHRVRKRFSFRTIFVYVFALMGVGYLILAWAPSPSWVVSGLIVTGLGMGFFMPNFHVWLVTAVPLAVRGRAIGGMATCLFLGQFFSPILTHPVLSKTSLSGLFLVAAVVLFFLAGLGISTQVRK